MKGGFSRRQPGERSWRFGWVEEVFVNGVDGGRGGGEVRKGAGEGGAHPYVP